MDLWILCAEKANLIKVDNVYIEEFYDREMTYYYEIRTKKNDDEICLGCFETKERALEVIGEIQTLLLGDVLLFKNFNMNSEDLSEIGSQLKTKVLGMVDVKSKDTDIKFIPRDCIVYEMPKE